MNNSIKDDKFTERIGLFLGVVCANLMGVCIVLAVSMDNFFYCIPGAISTIGMVTGFCRYCNLNDRTYNKNKNEKLTVGERDEI